MSITLEDIEACRKALDDASIPKNDRGLLMWSESEQKVVMIRSVKDYEESRGPRKIRVKLTDWFDIK